MEIIRCVIVDDKPLAVDILSDYVGKVPYLKLNFSTTNPLLALNEIMDNGADLVFLDIQMPQLNGVQFMKIVQGKCKVILTTAYPEYALDGFEHDAIDYLLKPISFERFYKSIQKAQHYFQNQQSIDHTILATPSKAADFIFIKTAYKLAKVMFDDILYIEGMQNYISIYTLNGKIISLQNIKKIEDQLPKKSFARVHKSYLIAINKIETIERSRIHIGGALIPLGDSYREAFYKLIGADPQV